MRVPEAKQCRTDEAKAKSIVCDALFLENQGFLNEEGSPKKVWNALKMFYTKTDEGIASPNQTAITRRLSVKRQAAVMDHGCSLRPCVPTAEARLDQQCISTL
ncbi:hypothetical protein E4U60_001962 [Claviceps pazoutovae]|uniref:Uncharacterized protein n=1 Tax=Claviceps pazoutovae TaxID=1649127 RepID=A0A9P7MBY1_9HYPO|nr:hypothetical protein E4U60_001962 [Claviceps pazoutovae]